jgi:hypothetical protein
VLALIACRPRLFFKACASFSSYLDNEKETVQLAKFKGPVDEIFTGDETLASVIMGTRCGLSRHEAWSVSLGTLSAYIAQGSVIDRRGARIRNTDQEEAELAIHEKLNEALKNG